MKYRTRIYDHKDYWEDLIWDVINTAGSIDIHVPYIKEHKFKVWAPTLRKLAHRGRTVRIHLQLPPDWYKRDNPNLDHRIKNELNQFADLLKWVESIGAISILHERIHAKLILIDEHILWEGSLNFLSHYDTTEHLRRSINPREVDEVRKRHSLGHIIDNEDYPQTNEQLKAMIMRRRTELNMSQSEVARAVKCAPSDVSRFESGKISGIHPVLWGILKFFRLEIVVVPSHIAGPVRKNIEELLRQTPR